jgi:hypothetical protein
MESVGETSAELLIDSILTLHGLSSYVSAFQHFAVPDDWPQIQNPASSSI